MRQAPILLLVILASLFSLPATSKSKRPAHIWPIPAEVVRVIDGDTVVVNAYAWPMLTIEGASIRVLGIDTPELRGKCAREKAMAKQAKELMVKAFPAGTLVQLLGVKPDKYGGRFNARVMSSGGQSWSALLFEANLAAPYNGQGPKRNWCADPQPPNSN